MNERLVREVEAKAAKKDNDAMGVLNAYLLYCHLCDSLEKDLKAYLKTGKIKKRSYEERTQDK